MVRVVSMMCITLALLIALVLAVPALAFLAAPKRTPAATWQFVMPMASVPEDGVPRTYAVLAEDRDAWTVQCDRVVGQVFLLRMDTGTVRAFATYHLTDAFPSPVQFDASRNVFRSQCWPATFGLDGLLLGDSAQSGSDDMILLATKVDGQGLWVTNRPAVRYGRGHRGD